MSKNMKVSKFDVLMEKIPRNPEVWDENDVITWLQIIGMEQYIESFKENKVDGLTILDLKEDEIEEELKINTKLHKKKVVKAIEILKEYQVYFIEATENEFKETTVSGNHEKKSDENTASEYNEQLTRGQDSVSKNIPRDRNRFNNQVIDFNNLDSEENIFRNKGQAVVSQNKKVLVNQRTNEDIVNIPQAYSSNQNSWVNSDNIERFKNFDKREDEIGRQNLSEDSNMGICLDYIKPLNKQSSSQNAGVVKITEDRDIEKEYVANKKDLSIGKNVIIINSIEGPSDLNHTIDENGAKIGRHSSNQIVIYDESVSRYHAEILFSNDNFKFMLKDIGSTSGTFLKIIETIELKPDMIIEIGSYQLMVTNLFIANSSSFEENIANSYVEFTIYESPDEIQERVFNLVSGSSIGRKVNNALCFSDDLHMSNLHCKINLIGQKFIFEDMASTNGSWLRLSKEGIESPQIVLSHETVFKIGNSAMYQVQLENIEKKEINEKSFQGNQCIICLDSERDCLIMPCRHNVSCTKCIKSIKKCPVCREDILDIIKIYKA